VVIGSDLRSLLDQVALARLLHDYGHHIDYGAKAAWLALFTDDARYVLRYRPGLKLRRIGAPEQVDGDLVYRGMAALSGFIAAHSHAPDRWHKHVVTNWRIDLNGDRAGVTSYFFRIDAAEAGTRIVAGGRYLDRAIRCPDEQWRFAERIAEIEMQ